MAQEARVVGKGFLVFVQLRNAQIIIDGKFHGANHQNYFNNTVVLGKEKS